MIKNDPDVNIRITKRTHKKMRLCALKADMSVKDYISHVFSNIGK